MIRDLPSTSTREVVKELLRLRDGGSVVGRRYRRASLEACANVCPKFNSARDPASRSSNATI